MILLQSSPFCDVVSYFYPKVDRKGNMQGPFSFSRCVKWWKMEIDKYFYFYLKALLHFVPPLSSVPYCIEMWKKSFHRTKKVFYQRLHNFPIKKRRLTLLLLQMYNRRRQIPRRKLCKKIVYVLSVWSVVVNTKTKTNDCCHYLKLFQQPSFC